MATELRRAVGFTLIELMVTVAVFVILALIAAPSFYSLRQRSAIRDAGDQALSFWNQARFEAAKQNQYVKVGVTSSGSTFCLGAAIATSTSDTAPCDCTPGATSNVCNVARFPNDQIDWRNVTLSGNTLGSGAGGVVIDPRLTSLTQPADAGTITLASPTGSFNYKLNLHIDQLGRGVLCESTTDTRPMSDYMDRRCSP